MVDNASTDGSVEFVRKHFPHVRIIQNERNLGFAEGNNVAMRVVLREGKSEYIMILNPDTVMEPDCIERLVEAAERHPQIGAFAPKIRVWGKPHKLSSAGGDCLLRSGDNLSRAFYFDDEGRFDQEEEIFGPSGAAALYRVSMLREIGLYDPKLFAYYEDVDLNFRIQKSGWGALYVPQAVVYHHHSGSLNDFNPYKTYLLNRNKYLVILKNYPLSLLWHYKWPLLRSFAAFTRYCFRNRLRRTWLKIIVAVLVRLPAVMAARWRLRHLTRSEQKERLMRFIEEQERLMAQEAPKRFAEYLEDLRSRNL